MPINRNLQPKSEKLRKLAILLDEAERRGIEVDRSVLNREVVFPVDQDGYFVKVDGTKYNPNEKQLTFLNSDAVLAAFISGRGAGKSTTGAQKAIRKIAQGEDGAVFNPKFEDFKTSTWPEFRLWLPWDMVVLSQRYMGNPEWSPSRPFVLNFLNGAFVICKGLSNPDSARGPNINWLWYDEARNDLTGDSWKIAVASVRVGHQPQAWVTTTPRGKAHWLYQFFIKQEIPEEAFEAFKEADPIWIHGPQVHLLSSQN